MARVFLLSAPFHLFFRVPARGLTNRGRRVLRIAREGDDFGALLSSHRTRWRISELPMTGRRFAASFLLLLSVTGCSLLPGAGPAGVVMQANGEASSDGYAVVDVDERVIAALKWRSDPSLRNLSEYKPASAPVIGIGDTLRVTVWEAAPGNLFATVGNTPKYNWFCRQHNHPRSNRAARGYHQCAICGRRKGSSTNLRGKSKKLSSRCFVQKLSTPRRWLML